MPLIGLVGGGYPALDSTALSTKQSHPLGTVAVDSSGGRYLYVRGSSAALAPGAVGYITPPTFQFTVTSTGATPTNTGGLVAVALSSGGSTASFMWAQTHGPAVALGDSTAAGAGINLFISTSVAGALSVTTTGARLYAAHIASSNASSLWNVYLNHVGTNNA